MARTVWHNLAASTAPAALLLALSCGGGTDADLAPGRGGSTSGTGSGGADSDSGVLATGSAGPVGGAPATGGVPAGGGSSPTGGTGAGGTGAAQASGGEAAGSDAGFVPDCLGEPGCCDPRARVGNYQMTVQSPPGRCGTWGGTATDYFNYVQEPVVPPWECTWTEQYSSNGCSLTRRHVCAQDSCFCSPGWSATSEAQDEEASVLQATLEYSVPEGLHACTSILTVTAERPVAGAPVCRESCSPGEYCESVIVIAADATSTARTACRPFPAACSPSDETGVPSCDCVLAELGEAELCFVDEYASATMLFVSLPYELDCPASEVRAAPGASLVIASVEPDGGSWRRFTLRNVSEQPVSTADLFVGYVDHVSADESVNVFGALGEATLDPGQDLSFLESSLEGNAYGQFVAVYRGLTDAQQLDATGADNRMVAYVQWQPEGHAQWAEVAVDAGLWSDAGDTVASAMEYPYLLAVGDVTTGAGYLPIWMDACLPDAE